MKTPRLLTLLATAQLCAASPPSSPAADVVVDISSFAPRDPNVILRQIELNVAIKEYEKVLMEVYEARMQNEVGPTETGLTDAGQKEWHLRAETKLKYLESASQKLRDRIRDYVDEAETMAREIEKEKAREKAGPDTSPGQTKAGPAAQLQGEWEGVEVGRESEGKCALTVTGDTLNFQGATKGEWYRTTFTSSVGVVPEQLNATITECPAQGFVGKTARSIYKIEGGTLTIVGHPPGAPEAPKSFAGDGESRTFVFKKAQIP